MSNDLIELTAKIVEAQLSQNKMDTDEISKLISTVFRALKRAKDEEEGQSTEEMNEDGKRTYKSSIRKHKIICLECGKSFKQLSRHHLTWHNLTPEEYRKKYGIPIKQALVAKSVSKRRKQLAIEGGLAQKMIAARHMPTGVNTVSSVD